MYKKLIMWKTKPNKVVLKMVRKIINKWQTLTPLI